MKLYGEEGAQLSTDACHISHLRTLMNYGQRGEWARLQEYNAVRTGHKALVEDE